MAETVNAISKLKQIFLVAEIVGDFDVIALAMIRDFDDAVNINIKIRKIPSVSQVEIAFTSNTTFPLTDKFGSIFQYEELWKNFSKK